MRIRTVTVPASFVVVALLAAIPAQAQNKIGVIGGVNLSSASFDPSVSTALQGIGLDTGESTGKTGFGVGISFERALSPKANLRLHGLFNQIGFGIKGNASLSLAGAGGLGASPAGASAILYEVEQKVTLNEFDIDALVNLPVGAAARFSINAGMFFSFLMSDKQTFREVLDGDVDEGTVEEEDEIDIKGSDVGVAVGGEFKITRQVIVGALYRLGLVNRDNDADEEDALFNSVKSRAIFIYVVIPIGGN